MIQFTVEWEFTGRPQTRREQIVTAMDKVAAVAAINNYHIVPNDPLRGQVTILHVVG